MPSYTTSSGRTEAPNDPDAEYWRGQRLRQGWWGGKKRYEKRGGRNLEYFNKLAAEGCLQPTESGATRVARGEAFDSMNEMKRKGKGKGEGTGKCPGDNYLL